ncbi:MAG: response regulator, partial [Acidobacteriales bacterium]|nr:response regulator [Terriglobales bacterium]
MAANTTTTTTAYEPRTVPEPVFAEERSVGRPSGILIVDSEEINRRLMKAIFKTAPYRIHEARRASEAMRMLQSERIDLVILDLMLP